MSLGIEQQYIYISNVLIPGIITKYPACYNAIRSLLATALQQTKGITDEAVAEVTLQMDDLLSNYGLQCAGVQILGKGDLLQATSDKMDLIKKMATGSIFDKIIKEYEALLLGDLFVVNAANSKVVKYSSDGHFKYLGSFGGPGSTDGRFNSPKGIKTQQKTGNLFVVDSGNSRVQVFDPDGQFVSKWGTAGSGDLQFNEPYALAFDTSQTYAYVTDSANNRVQIVYASSGLYAGQWGSFGSAAGEFDHPLGIAVDRNNDIYVVDSRNLRIQKFALIPDPAHPGFLTASFLRTWNVLDYPIGIDSVDLRLFVTCASSNLVRVYSRFGSFVESYAGGLEEPKSIAVSGISPWALFITDSTSIHKFQGDGRYVFTETGFQPEGITLGASFSANCSSLVSVLENINIDIGTLDLSQLTSVFAALTDLLGTAANVLGTIATVLGCGQEMLGEVNKIIPSAGALNVSVSKAIDNVSKAQETVSKSVTETKYVLNVSPYIIQLGNANVLKDQIQVKIDGKNLPNDTTNHPTDPDPGKFSLDYVKGIVYFNKAQKGKLAQIEYSYADLNDVFGTAKSTSVTDLGLDVDLNTQKATLARLNNFFH